MTKTISQQPSFSAAVLPDKFSKTGLTEESNYETVKYNAMKHGVLSTVTVLPHEDMREFITLRQVMMAEHKPSGPTETYLVEDLTAIIWRRRRGLIAEGAKINKSLYSAINNSSSRPAKHAVPFQSGMPDKPDDWLGIWKSTPEDVQQSLDEAKIYLEKIEEVLGILRRGDAKAYEKALKAISDDEAENWHEFLEDELYQPVAEDLEKYLVTHVWPLAVTMVKEAEHHFAIKNQALGEGFQPLEFESLCRYETHLDRKFQRTLGMLIKLKELRTR